MRTKKTSMGPWIGTEVRMVMPGTSLHNALGVVVGFKRGEVYNTKLYQLRCEGRNFAFWIGRRAFTIENQDHRSWDQFIQATGIDPRKMR